MTTIVEKQHVYFCLSQADTASIRAVISKSIATRYSNSPAMTRLTRSVKEISAGVSMRAPSAVTTAITRKDKVTASTITKGGENYTQRSTAV